MLYFMGYSDSHGSWTGNFTRAMREGLKQSGVPHVELPPYDWTAGHVRVSEYLKINSKDEDAWFIGWGQSPLIEIISSKKGRKYGLVVGLTEQSFDPAVLAGAGDSLFERRRFGLYDKIFANSHWCARCIRFAYPELASRVVVVGFPIDFGIYAPYADVAKENNLIVLNQRFALEKLHVLEIELARILVDRGWRVQHLSGMDRKSLTDMNPSLAGLFELAEKVGLEFVHNKNKEEYHANLARAAVVLTTSIADMLPSSMIEAIHLGAVPVAPRAFCFPEFIHNDNLFTPYDLGEILNIIERRPLRHHPITLYSSQRVIARYLKEMDCL